MATVPRFFINVWIRLHASVPAWKVWFVSRGVGQHVSGIFAETRNCMNPNGNLHLDGVTSSFHVMFQLVISIHSLRGYRTHAPCAEFLRAIFTGASGFWWHRLCFWARVRRYIYIYIYIYVKAPTAVPIIWLSRTGCLPLLAKEWTSGFRAVIWTN